MGKLNKRYLILLICFMCVNICGCSKIREIVDSYEAPTEPIKTTNENEYTAVTTEQEIYDMISETMRSNKPACYFSVTEEEMIKPEQWEAAFDGVEEVKAEYTKTQNGFNVFLSLTYWDCYPIVEAFQKSDTTTLSATQLELFDKYYDILGTCTSNSYTDYENLLVIHDYLVSNVEFGENSDGVDGAYGALIKGKAKCAGYTESFKTLLDMLDIENKVVKGYKDGEEHVWNLIKLDGEWYHVDVTLNDLASSAEAVSHKYFNLTDADMGLDHIWDAEAYPQAAGTKMSYYKMQGVKEIYNQDELSVYFTEQVAAQTENLEFLVYGEVDLEMALQTTGVAMDVSYSILNMTEFSVYNITIAYK